MFKAVVTFLRCAAILGPILLGLAGRAQAQTPPPDVVEYYHLDALESVRAVTDANGALVARHEFFPFGEGDGTVAGQAAVRFTGKERDAESGLDYFGARYYASRAGRFTTVDPAMDIESSIRAPQHWNRYAYVANNPLRWTDPDGRCTSVLTCTLEFGAAGAATGATAGAVLGGPVGAVIAGAAGALVGGTVAVGTLVILHTPPSTATDAGIESSFRSEMSGLPPRTAADPLPRDNGGKPIPDPEAVGRAHSQLGTRQSKSQPGSSYKQAREFDENGREVKRIDFTNHGRKDHPNPHQHRPTKTGKPGRPEPVDPDIH